MWLFRSKKTKQDKEAQIRAIKEDTIQKIEIASQSIHEVNKLLDSKDVTLRIFYATKPAKRSVK